MVLNKKEKVLMKIIFGFANNKKGQCIVSPVALLQAIPYKYEFRESDLDKVLNDLALEGYFDFEHAIKKDETLYVIKLKEKGFSYARDLKTSRRKIIKSIITTLAIALLSILAKQIFSRIFG